MDVSIGTLPAEHSYADITVTGFAQCVRFVGQYLLRLIYDVNN